LRPRWGRLETGSNRAPGRQKGCGSHQAEKKLAVAQQALSRKKRGSHRRKKAVQHVANCHRKIARQRKDFHHKASRKLVNQYQVIVFEDLQVKNLTKAPAPKQDENGKYVPNGAAAKAGLNASILDAGWSTFTGCESYLRPGTQTTFGRDAANVGDGVEASGL
jgi:hypothetical protein